MSEVKGEVLNERERDVLHAVIRTYVETAGPAGSRTVAKRFNLGVSAATVRNTMADLEDKGYLFHPHTSAGRVPTDLAYRYYVDMLMPPVELTVAENLRLRRELAEGDPMPLEQVVRRTAQALGLLTGELGLAVAPKLEHVVLEKLELVSVSSEKLLLVLTLRSGVVRTVYVDLPFSVPAATLVAVTVILNERLAGQSLKQIKETLPDRLRDSSLHDPRARDLLNVFLQAGDEVFQWRSIGSGDVHLGKASLLADQPEFATGSELRRLMELTEKRELLAAVLGDREHQTRLEITIGREHQHAELSKFTLVTSQYRSGGLSGVIGVIGPTRMPYENVAAIVERTSGLLSEMLDVQRSVQADIDQQDEEVESSGRTPTDRS